MKVIFYVIGAVMLFLAGFIGYQFQLNCDTPLAGVPQGSEYHSTAYSSAVATSTLVKTGGGALGSVIITEDQAGTVILYDATSTAAIGNGLTTTIASFPAAATEGTYAFDVALYRGLAFVTSTGFNFAGEWTITYR